MFNDVEILSLCHLCFMQISKQYLANVLESQTVVGLSINYTLNSKMEAKNQPHEQNRNDVSINHGSKTGQSSCQLARNLQQSFSTT